MIAYAVKSDSDTIDAGTHSKLRMLFREIGKLPNACYIYPLIPVRKSWRPMNSHA